MSSSSDLNIAVLKSLRSTVVIAGALGNLVSFLIFLRPAFKTNSISTYCRALAIADLYTLFFLAYDIQWLIDRTRLTDRSDSICAAYFFVSFSMSSMPGWILAVFSLDKLLTVRLSSSSCALIKKKSFQWSLVAFVCLVNFLININLAISLRLTYLGCFIPSIDNYLLTSIIGTIMTNILPFVIMIVTSVLIISTLRSLRMKIKISTNSMTKNATGDGEDRKKSFEIKFAVSSLTFNILFVVMRLPLSMTFILIGFGIYLGEEFQEIASLLFATYSSATLLIHLASNSIFRAEMVEFFKQSFWRCRNCGVK